MDGSPVSAKLRICFLQNGWTNNRIVVFYVKWSSF
jgi:hypothetical protein